MWNKPRNLSKLFGPKQFCYKQIYNYSLLYKMLLNTWTWTWIHEITETFCLVLCLLWWIIIYALPLILQEYDTENHTEKTMLHWKMYIKEIGGNINNFSKFQCDCYQCVFLNLTKIC